MPMFRASATIGRWTSVPGFWATITHGPHKGSGFLIPEPNDMRPGNKVIVEYQPDDQYCRFIERVTPLDKPVFGEVDPNAPWPPRPKHPISNIVELRKQYPDIVLVFRCGDFYELFDGDAETVAKTLGLSLTRRGETAMAGFPRQRLETYLRKLLREGLRVAICDHPDARY